ncbi:MAG TPA: nitrate reductase, partial [Rhodobacteraceae bacterium]|nr:nitrate reductase [Paracoccaceae bacterium]
MTFISVIFALAFYAATLILVGGLGFKIWQFWRTPAPLKIPVTPAPVTRLGVGVRIIKEVAFFASLFKSNKWTWMFGVLFHAALLVVVLRHLRYFTEPVWLPIALIQPFGVYAGFAMLAGLALLFARRLLVPRVRYITGFSDYLMLVLLFFIGFS